MNIDDGKVLALNGAMLAEGTFEFEGAEASEFIQPARSLILVSPGEDYRRTEFALVSDPRRDADGLWSSQGSPVHSIAFSPSVPTLDRLLDFPSFLGGSDRARFTFGGEHAFPAWVALDTVYGEERTRDSLLGHANSLELDVERNAEAFVFSLSARVDGPKRGDSPAPPVTVRINAALSFATMALAGSRLWWKSGAERWDQQGEDRQGPLAKTLTLDRAGGNPFFEGTLDLGPGLPEVYRGTWVEAQVFGRRLTLRPQKPPKRLPGGFCTGFSSGPQLVLNNLGPEAWKEMLAHSDEAELIQSGEGIGYTQPVTGRDVQDEGPHEQPITMMRTRLRRTREGLSVSLVGELGPIRQAKPHYEPLGPDFGVEFLVPTPLLFAQGIHIGDMFQQRRSWLESLEGR